MSPGWPSSENIQVLATLHIIHQNEENPLPARQPLVQPPKAREKVTDDRCQNREDRDDPHEAYLDGQHKHCCKTLIKEHSHKVYVATGRSCHRKMHEKHSDEVKQVPGHCRHRETHVEEYRQIENTTRILSTMVE